MNLDQDDRIDNDDVDENGADENRADEREFAERLAEVDEALADGADHEVILKVIQGNAGDRLARGAACLDQLRKLWPQRGNGSSKTDTKRVSQHADTRPQAVGVAAYLPERLGRFEIRRELGRGGNGIVFLAFDPNLNREVALKVPHFNVMIDSQLRDRFFQESRAAAGLDHAHVVPVYEAGEIGPVCYIASAYCPGPTLADWLRRQTEPIRFDDTAEITAVLADAVEHAHERGVLHRDLKPSNVLMVGRFNEEAGASGHGTDAPGDNSPLPVENPHSVVERFVPRITDFGLAKVVGTKTDATSSGAVVGTPAYMAPEQARGKASEVGPEADVYALGAILYELITGRAPFQGETPLEILIQVRSVEPLAPSTLRPGTPRDLETICRKCLEKDPSRRYADASRLADDLRRFLKRQPIQARPIGRLEKTWRWCRSRPLVAGLLAALLLVVAAGFSGVYWQWRRAEARASEASRERRIARREQQRAEQTLHASIDSINEFFTKVSQEHLLDEPGTQRIRKDLLESARDHYVKFLELNRGDPHLVVELASARLRVGQVLDGLGKPVEARREYVTATRDLSAHLVAHPADRKAEKVLAECRIEIAHNLGDMGDDRAAVKMVEQSIDRIEKRYRENPEDAEYKFLLANLLETAAMRCARTKDQGRVMDLCRQAQALLEQLIDDEPKLVRYRIHLMGVYHIMGRNLLDAREMQQAVEMFEKALDCFPNPSQIMAVNRNMAVVHLDLGIAMAQIGRNAAAAENYETARKLLQRLVRANPESRSDLPLLGAVFQNEGVQYRRMNNVDAAIHSYDHAGRIFSQLTEEQPETIEYAFARAKAKLGMGFALQTAGKPQEALGAFEEAFAISSELATNHPENSEYSFFRANCGSVIGTCHARRRDFETSREFHRKAIEQYEQILSRHPDNIRARSAIGAVLNDYALTLIIAKRFDEAMEPSLQAISHQRAALAAAPNVVTHRTCLSRHYSTLARLYRETGRWRKSLEMCRQRRELWSGVGSQLIGPCHLMLRIVTAIDEAGDNEPNSDAAAVRRTCVNEALDTLDQAIEAGFKDRRFLENDPVVAVVRSHPRFQKALGKLKADQDVR